MKFCIFDQEIIQSNKKPFWFQETFLKVFQNLKKVKEAEALPGWIKKIAVNTCLDHLRLDKISWIAPVEGVEKEDPSYSEFLDRFSAEIIVQLINELPEGYRAVLNLYIVDGYSHKEISEKLKIGESTSRSQLTYAKRLLKEKLKKLGIEKYESVI